MLFFRHCRTTNARMAACLACAWLSGSGWSLEAGAQQEATAFQTLLLAVRVNEQDAGAVMQFEWDGERLYARAQDLREVGIEPGDIAGRFALDELPGLQYDYDASRQQVDIVVPVRMRTTYIHGQDTARPALAGAGRGLVLNLDAYAQYADRGHLALWNEWRYFDRLGVFEHSAAAYAGQGTLRNRYLRFETAWTHYDPQAMRQLRLGDTISSSLDWGRSVRLGGFQWSRNFELRPDLVTYPLPQLGGMAVVPTSADLYINQIQRASIPVPDGPFLFDQAPGITGAGEATIVTRDALGRAVATTLPIYVDRRMLARGLQAYSVEAGFVRKDFGLSSFRYDSAPAASATWRHGWSDALTLEAHGQMRRGLLNGGVSALVGLGRAGVLQAGVAGSGTRRKGALAVLGYQRIAPRFSLDVQATRRFGAYRDLGSLEGLEVPERTERATLSWPMGSRQSMAVSYMAQRSAHLDASRVMSLAYTLTPGSRMSVNLSAYHDLGPRRDHGVLLSMSMALDQGASWSAYTGRQNGQNHYNVTAGRPAPYEGGWGWGVQAGRMTGARWEQAQLDYRGRKLEASAVVQRIDGRHSTALNASGALVFMDGSVHGARRIHDGFALVSTDGMAGIPVLHENRRIGRTDESGHLLVSDLNAYQRNRLGIDGSGLPANVRVESTSVQAVPAARSGVLVRFPLNTYRAATVLLMDERGQPLPVGSRVRHRESAAQTVVGYEGAAFIDALAPTNHVLVESGAQTCRVRFAYEPDQSDGLPVLGPFVCRRDKEAM